MFHGPVGQVAGLRLRARMPRRLVAILAGVSAVVALAAGPAVSAPPDPAAGAPAEIPAAQWCVDTAATEAAARALASRCGVQVEDVSARTESSVVLANPDG